MMKLVFKYMLTLIGFMTINACSSDSEESKMPLEESVQQSIELLSEIEKLDNLIQDTKVSFDSISLNVNEIISNMDSIKRFDLSNEN